MALVVSLRHVKCYEPPSPPPQVIQDVLNLWNRLRVRYGFGIQTAVVYT